MSEAVAEGGAVQATPEVSGSVSVDESGVPSEGVGSEESFGQGEVSEQEGRFLEGIVDGEPVKISEAEAIKAAQLQKASYKRMEESANRVKEAEAKVAEAQRTQSNWNTVVKSLRGGSIDQQHNILRAIMGDDAFMAYHQSSIDEIAHYEGLSEEGRKLYEAERQLKHYKSQADRRREARERESLAAETKAAEDFYTREFTSALNEVGVPVTPYAIERMAQLGQYYIQNGKQVNSKHIAKTIRDEYAKEFSSISSLEDRDKAIEFMGGEKNIKNLSTHLANKINPMPSKTAPRRAVGQNKTKQKISSREFFARRERERRNRG